MLRACAVHRLWHNYRPRHRVVLRCNYTDRPTMSAPPVMPMIHLYRNILKAAKYFPSRKRDRIIVEIKNEFRAKRGLSDVEAVAQARTVAERGLSDLQAYLPARATENGGSFDLSLKGACK